MSETVLPGRCAVRAGVGERGGDLEHAVAPLELLLQQRVDLSARHVHRHQHVGEGLNAEGLAVRDGAGVDVGADATGVHERDHSRRAVCWIQSAPEVAQSWASAMMSPSDDSPAAFCARQRRRRGAEHAVLDRRGDLAVLVDQRSDVGRRGLRVPPDDDVVDGCSDDVLGPPVDRQVDVGDQPADGRRTGDHDPRAGEVRAVERPVGVARDDEVDLAVEALDHINDRADGFPHELMVVSFSA